MREPTDKQWGVPGGGGNWTGIVGTLQHELADFSLDLTLTPGRAEVVEYSRIYIDESLVIVSSKPKPLPEFLSVIRPLEGELTSMVSLVKTFYSVFCFYIAFPDCIALNSLIILQSVVSVGEVWGAVVVCVMVWGSVLWVLEKSSHWMTGRRYLSFSSSIFYGWGLLLEDHPFEPPPSLASQVSTTFKYHVGIVFKRSFGYANLGSRFRSPDIRWPLVIIWYYCRVATDYPNCCHTVLRRDLHCLYVLEALAAIASRHFQYI